MVAKNETSMILNLGKFDRPLSWTRPMSAGMTVIVRAESRHSHFSAAEGIRVPGGAVNGAENDRYYHFEQEGVQKGLWRRSASLGPT
jgi:hypothetical protein